MDCFREIKLKEDLTSGIFTILLSGLILFIIPSQIRSTTSQVSGFNADYFPRLLCCVMLVCGISLVAKSLVTKKDEEIVIRFKDEFRVLIYALLMIAYVAVIAYIGFLISTLLFSVVSLLLIRCKNKWYYLAVVLLSVGLWACFVYLLGVNLPGSRLF